MERVDLSTEKSNSKVPCPEARTSLVVSSHLRLLEPRQSDYCLFVKTLCNLYSVVNVQSTLRSLSSRGNRPAEGKRSPHFEPEGSKCGSLVKRMWRRPTFPQGCPCSIIGAERLNCRVRNGNGCFPLAKTTTKLGGPLSNCDCLLVPLTIKTRWGGHNRQWLERPDDYIECVSGADAGSTLASPFDQ